MNLTNVCVDASIAVVWLFDPTFSDSADNLLRDWRRKDAAMLVPAIFHAEVASAIRRRLLSKQILADEADEAFAIVQDIPVTTIEGPAIRRTAWRLANDFGLSACYDAQYLAVAEYSDCEIWTADRRLFNTLNGRNYTRVRLLPGHTESKNAGRDMTESKRHTPQDTPGLWQAI